MSAARSDNRLHKELASVRDTVESIWVAIVLAFVLRAFMIEAFVIPTGSMAPRLLGEHWDLQCPACGYEFAFGWPHGQDMLAAPMDQRVAPSQAQCPNCRWNVDFAKFPRYVSGGDRVLVMKYLYHFIEPQPWDVIVFRNPQNNRDNYIKRLIGLPGETIEIVHGDVFVSRDGSDFNVRRKPRQAQEAMWQIINDNDYQPATDWRQKAECPKWTPQEGWQLADGGRTFEFSGGAASAVEFQAQREVFFPHYGYNALRHEKFNNDADIVSDLKLSAAYTPQAKDSRVQLLLSSFQYAFKAEISADGSVDLFIGELDQAQWRPWKSARIAPLALDEPATVAMEIADLSVTVRVDGRSVLSVADGEYPVDYQWLKQRMSVAAVEKVPEPKVYLAAEAGPCRLQHVLLMRDVYYTAPDLSPPEGGPLGDYARSKNIQPGRNYAWAVSSNPITLKDADDADLDEFFVLGDNSPQSLDSRMWTSAAPTLRQYAEGGYRLGTVPRYNLIGKAFFVYWPGGFRLPGLPRLPIIPNVGRMRMIR